MVTLREDISVDPVLTLLRSSKFSSPPAGKGRFVAANSALSSTAHGRVEPLARKRPSVHLILRRSLAAR
jgi:hypothetical protein